MLNKLIRYDVWEPEIARVYKLEKLLDTRIKERIRYRVWERAQEQIEEVMKYEVLGRAR